MVTGFIHSLIVFFLPLYHFKEVVLGNDAENSDIWSFSVTSFSAVIFIVTFKLLFFSRFFTVLNFVAIALLSVGLFYGYTWFSNYMVE